MKTWKACLLITITSVVTYSCCTEINTDEIKENILDTDRAFSEHSKAHGMQDAFYVFADEHCVILRENTYPIVGREMLRELLAQNPDDSILLTWEPLFVDVSGSGDLGYTYGTFKIRMKDGEQQPVSEGCYVSIWKKQPDGTWKFVLDTGTQGLGE